MEKDAPFLHQSCWHYGEQRKVNFRAKNITKDKRSFHNDEGLNSPKRHNNLKTHTPNNGILKYKRQELMECNRKSATMVGYFHNLFQ